MAKSLLGLVLIAAAALAVPAAPTPVATGAPMPAGLVAQLHFDEGQGQTAADATGKANDGALKGAATWCQGNWGTAAGLDGIGAYVDLGTCVSMNLPAGGFTISAWINTTDLYGPIVALRHPSNSIQVSLAVGYDGSANAAGKLMALVRKDGAANFARVTGATVNDGAWHHVAVTKDATTTIELFLDGVSQGTNTHADASGAFTSTYRSIGADLRWNKDISGTDDQRWLAGGVEEVQVYKRQLPLAELQALAVKTAPDPQWTPPGPLGWWKGDDGATPTTAADASGYNHPGTYQSATTSTSVPVPGPANPYCMQFSGTTSSCVDAPGFSWPAGGGPVTIAYWEYVTSADVQAGGTTFSSTFSVGNAESPNRFQAHSPYSDHLLYWDYGNYNDGSGRLSTNYAAYEDKWTHVVLVSSGNGGAFQAIYLNGALAASSTKPTAGTSAALTGLNIGRWNGHAYFKGKIDDFRIYDRMLTASDVDAILDVTPPSATAVGAAAASHDSVTLTWTAPGDDGVSGMATAYDLRYSSVQSIDTDSDFDAAASAGTLPLPQAPGTIQSLTLRNLAESQSYWFAIKTRDNAKNWSPRSASLQVSTTSDSAPDPAALAVVETTIGSVTLTWISPGDDGMAGSAAIYDLRCSTTGPILGDADFQAATPVAGLPAPRAAGNVETFTVGGLKRDTVHHFAIRTGDATAHWSALSNDARASTFAMGSNGVSWSDAFGSCGASAGPVSTVLLLLLTAVAASVILRGCNSPRSS